MKTKIYASMQMLGKSVVAVLCR